MRFKTQNINYTWKLWVHTKTNKSREKNYQKIKSEWEVFITKQMTANEAQDRKHDFFISILFSSLSPFCVILIGQNSF